MAPSAADRHALGFEPRLAGAVGARAALRGLDVDGRSTASSSVSVGSRRSVNCFAAIGPTVVTNSPARNVRRTRLQRRDRFGNREDVFERRVPAGPVADEDDVVVGVDDAGNDGPALEVDPLRAAAPDAVAGLREAPAPSRAPRDDAAACVHRVDSAVDEQDVLRLCDEIRYVERAEGKGARAAEKAAT